MAFTNEQEAGILSMYAAFQNGKRINQLDRATGTLADMLVAVQDNAGETRKINLSEAVETAGNPIAGRYWNELNASPTAAGYYGSLAALKELPKKLGLGRYLVTDDRVRRKLDPADTNRFEDGSPAKLDGSQGQYMWCWNAHYYSTWKEGNNLVEVITFLPIEGKKSVFVPAGGISWLGGGVMDRTEQKLCSVISTDERYRGGNGSVLNYPNLADSAPQKTQLGMVATALPCKSYSTYARKRGEGWEANWFVARAVVEYTIRIILGTRQSQGAYNPNLDADGLYQGGLGSGVTDMPDWLCYNGCYPIIPTSVGIEKGDGTGVIEYSVTKGDGTSVYVAPVPVFFGLINPFGHIWGITGGVVIDAGEVQTLGYVAPSMATPLDCTKTEGLLLAAVLPRSEGWTKKYSTHLLCGLPTEVGGTPATYFCDFFHNNLNECKGLMPRLVGGSSYNFTSAGAFCTNAYSTFATAGAGASASLCFFAADPVITE